MTRRTRLLVASAVVVVVAAVTVLAGLAVLESRKAPVLAPREKTADLEPLDTTVPPAPLERPPSGLGTAPGELQETPQQLREFDVQAAMNDIRALEAFGPRGGGSQAEASAAEYIRSQLAALGLDARIETFPLPNGATSRNVVARIAGSSPKVLVLGAHMDSKPPSPGANDNATGCAALLEIARILAERPVTATVEFVFFGSEETSGGDPNGHHYGSRFRVSQLSAAERANTAGMISVDMIGFGTGLHSRTMGKGPLTLSDMLVARAKELGAPMTYLRDPGSSGWSDHEAFELAGIPVSWVEWRDDPVYHTAGDTSGHLSVARIRTAGALVLDFVRGLDGSELEALTAR
jgi:hypothetical protein